MPGIRIGHNPPVGSIVLRNQSFVVEHPTIDYTTPYLCPQCNTTHFKKAIHLQFDDQGTCIVSREVLQHLREAGMPELVILNEVESPPPRTIRITDAGVRGGFVAKTIKTQGGTLTVLRNRLSQPRAPRSKGEPKKFSEHPLAAH